MARGSIAVVALLGIMAFSGCAATTGTTASSSVPPPPAPTASITVDTGSITGAVVDEELQPLVDATVGLAGSKPTEARTDAAGIFTFNDLEPGDYTVIVEKLGYESTAKKASVRAGEISEVRFTLAMVEIAAEPFIVALPRTVFFQVDSGWLGFTTVEQVYANQSAFHGIRCNPCTSTFHVMPGPKSVQSELKWEGTYISPAGAPFVIMKYIRNWTDGTTGSAADSNTGTQVCRPVIEQAKAIRWSATCVKEAAKAHDKIKAWYFVSGLGVVVNLKVESWTALSYNAELPEEYRALPPP